MNHRIVNKQEKENQDLDGLFLKNLDLEGETCLPE